MTLKKVFIFLFIICTQLPFALTKLVLQWQKKAVRREVKKRINDGLKDEELVKLTFHQDDVYKLLKWAYRCFLIGILLFSGSLYFLTTRNLIGIEGLKVLGPVTPLGGLFFIAGWLLLGLQGLKKR